MKKILRQNRLFLSAGKSNKNRNTMLREVQVQVASKMTKLHFLIVLLISPLLWTT